MYDHLLLLRLPRLTGRASIAGPICAVEFRVALGRTRAEDMGDARSQRFGLVPAAIRQRRIIRRRRRVLPIGICSVKSCAMSACQSVAVGHVWMVQPYRTTRMADGARVMVVLVDGLAKCVLEQEKNSRDAHC